MSSAKVGRVKPSRGGVTLAFSVWGIVVYAFLFLPIGIIMIYSFNNGRAMLVSSGWAWTGTEPGSRIRRSRTP